MRLCGNNEGQRFFGASLIEAHFFIWLLRLEEIFTNDQNFGIVPYNGSLDISNSRGLTELKLGEGQKMQVGALLQQLPSASAAGTLADVYTVSFPEGITGKLMKYADGRFGTPIIGENGRIIAHASLESLAPQALAMGCFTAMSIASSQYFLNQINNELKMIRSSLDKILEFLYGDKKAELLAEASFVKYAFENYDSIMKVECQRAGIIANLIGAKKVAMKDIEFYLRDLDSAMTGKDVSSVIDKVFQIKESLEFSMQLYGMSSLLEVYYSQNFDKAYLNYVENDISVYIGKCEKRMLGDFSALKVMAEAGKGNLLKKVDNTAALKQIDDFIDILNKGEESAIRKSLKDALYATSKKARYYITKEGAVYLKTA